MAATATAHLQRLAVHVDDVLRSAQFVQFIDVLGHQGQGPAALGQVALQPGEGFVGGVGFRRAMDMAAQGVEGVDLVRVARRQYQRSSRLPAAFTERLLTNGAASYQAWVEAKPANDFKKVRPYLERTVELSRELASYFPGQGHVADPLIDQADAGMTVASVRVVFDELRKELRPLVDAGWVATEPDPAAPGVNHLLA